MAVLSSQWEPLYLENVNTETDPYFWHKNLHLMTIVYSHSFLFFIPFVQPFLSDI